MSKIIIIGNGGTGKSTLGEYLSKQKNIPVYHLDQLSWGEGWKRVPEAIFIERLQDILSTESWIIEGWAFHSTMRLRFLQADTILYLNYPIWFAYYGATKRYFTYYFRQNPYDPPNSLRRKVLWRTYKAMWMVYKRYVPDVITLIDEFRGSKNIYIFNSRRELKTFLEKKL